MPEQVITTEAATVKAVVHAVDVLTAAADQKLLDANASREAFIVSADVADVWLYYGVGPAVVRVGHCVRAAGSAFVERSWKGEVHVISTGAAAVGCTELELSVGDDQGEHPVGGDAFVPSGPGDTPIPPPSLSQQIPPPALPPNQ